MQFNLFERVKGLVLANRTTTTAATSTSTGVDMEGYTQVAVILQFDTIAATATVTVAKMQESVDNSVWTDIAGADFATLNVIDGDDDNKMYVGSIDLRQRARYLRISLTSTVGAATWTLQGLAAKSASPPGQTQNLAFQV